eukprot:5336953-Prymnesium_polylepis.1
MAAGEMLVRQIDVLDVNVSLISLADRRPIAPSDPGTTWAFQREVEAVLYGTDYASGAFYRLLHRSGVGSRALH